MLWLKKYFVKLCLDNVQVRGIEAISIWHINICQLHHSYTTSLVPASAKSEAKLSKESDSELQLRVKALQLELSTQLRDKQQLQASLDKALKEKQQVVADLARVSERAGQGELGAVRLYG